MDKLMNIFRKGLKAVTDFTLGVAGTTAKALAKGMEKLGSFAADKVCKELKTQGKELKTQGKAVCKKMKAHSKELKTQGTAVCKKVEAQGRTVCREMKAHSKELSKGVMIGAGALTLIAAAVYFLKKEE